MVLVWLPLLPPLLDFCCYCSELDGMSCVQLISNGVDADLDTDIPGGVTFVELLPDETGFCGWSRANGEARGRAEWVLPVRPSSACGSNEDRTSAATHVNCDGVSSENAGSAVAQDKRRAGPLTSPDRILFLHGGGYQYYAPWEKYRPLTARLALATGMPVLAIDYRKLPEHPFPAAVADTISALTWIWQHGPGSTQTLEPARSVFMCGDSAGGGLAFSCVNAILIGEVIPGRGHDSPAILPVGLPKLPTAIGALSPYTDCTCAHASYTTRAWREDGLTGDPVFSDGDAKGEMQACAAGAAEYYGTTDVRDPRVSPAFAADALLRQLPPTLVVVGDSEVMLGDSTELVARAMEAGAPSVALRVYPRMWHVFPMYSQGCLQGGAGTLAAAEHALESVAAFLQDHACR